MKIAFNPSTVAALTAPPNNKDITFDLRGRNIFTRGVKFQGTDTNTWRDIKVNNVSIGSNVLDLRNGSNTTLTNTNGVVTINSTWRPVVDNLTSNSTTSSLSANQGRVLKALIDGKSDSGHNHDGRYVRYYAVTTLDCNNLAVGLTAARAAATNAAHTNHSVYLYISDVETPFQIQIPDFSVPYIYKRYYSSGKWSGWFKLNAGYADSAGSVAWANITGKPSTFTPAAHTHTVFKNNLMIKGTNGISDSASIHLGIGDSDTGFKWISDGKCQMYANNVAVGEWTASGMNWFKNPTVNGNKVWNAGNDGSGSGLDADTVDGYHATSNNKPWGTIPVITTQGFMDIGKHLEFHHDNTTGSDYSTILMCTGNYSNIVNLPSESGTLALISQVVGISDFNWTTLPGKVVLGNEFNIVNSGFNNQLYFNYLPIDNRNGSATITQYNMGNGHKGLASVYAYRFKADGKSCMWKDARNYAPFYATFNGGFEPILDIKTKGGDWSIGSFDSWGDKLIFAYESDSDFNAGVNGTAQYYITTEGTFSGASRYINHSPGAPQSYMYSTGTGTYNGAIQIREVNGVLNNQSAWGYAPRITFHWGQRYAKGFGMRSDGQFAVDDVPIALTSNVLTFSNENADYLSVNFNNPDFSKKAASTYIECWDGAGGWWNWKAGKFMKAGSSDAYVLLGGGGHKAISTLSVSYATSAGSVSNSLNIFGVSYNGSAAKTVTTSTFVSQLPEGTSTVTDGTMFITSWASDSGFADTNAVNVPYKRKASCLWNYIDNKVSSKYLPLAGGTMNANARISHGDGNLYIGRADNYGWIYTQDIASQKGTDKWWIRESGAAHFGNVYICTKSDYTTYDSSIIECYNDTLYLNYYSSTKVILCRGGGSVGIGVVPTYKLDVAGSGRFQNFVYSNAVYSNTLNHTSSTGYLIIGNKTKEISIRSSNLPDIPAVYLYHKFSTNVYYTANKGFGIRPYYLSSRDYRPIETISGNRYSVVTVCDNVQAISCIIADKANLVPEIRGTLIRFLPGDDGQIVLLKDLNNYGSGNGYFYVQPKECSIVRPNDSGLRIANGDVSDAYDDGKSRFFIYAKTHKVWIEFYCG